MNIDIRGIPIEAGLRRHVMTELTDALADLGGRPVTAHATFVDDNGPGGGLRCALTLRLPYRPDLRVEAVADTTRQAFDTSFAALERQLVQYRERHREDRRHPREYDVAPPLFVGGLGRVVAGEPAESTRHGAAGSR